jgi:hypothetical protein
MVASQLDNIVAEQFAARRSVDRMLPSQTLRDVWFRRYRRYTVSALSDAMAP